MTTLSQMKRCIAVLASTLMLFGMPTSGHAITVYKSIGDYGEVKYSQFPPVNDDNVEVIELREDGRTVDTGEMAGQVNADGQSTAAPTAEEQRVAQLEARLQDQQERETAQRCQTLRNQLTNLNTGGRVYEMDNQGNRNYLDGREIELKKEQIQQAVNQYCSGNGQAT